MRYLLLLCVVALLAISCGDGFFVENVKRYYFAIEPATSENHRIFGQLFGDFNSRFNAPYLNIVRAGDLGQSETSTITLTPGLRYKDEKLGWGRWLISSKLNSRRSFLRRPNKVRRDTYTMELEFDHDYIKKRYYSSADNKQRELRTLFLHELGHGFQMGHDPEPQSVMYEKISDSYKDYRSFYLRVESFLRR